MDARTPVIALLAVAALALAACGESEKKLEVGACTTADPKEALSFDVKAIDCDDKDAKSKIVREVKKSDECDVASVSDSGNDKVYCTEPYPPGSAPARPAVGVCTTADPKQLISVNIRLVNCDDKAAKSKITKRAKSEAECDGKSVRGSKGEIFCIEPV
ncbi:MAG TPA: hypothetical protein VF520_12900 [Thermoleophilaceae bacterium]|jgi:hypothetical protein